MDNTGKRKTLDVSPRDWNGKIIFPSHPERFEVPTYPSPAHLHLNLNNAQVSSHKHDKLKPQKGEGKERMRGQVREDQSLSSGLAKSNNSGENVANNLCHSLAPYEYLITCYELLSNNKLKLSAFLNI